MTHRTPLAIVALAACLCTAPMPAAHAAGNDNGLDQKVLFAMQRDLGIFPGQVEQYLETERTATTRRDAFERDLGADYAGSWIERGADGVFRFVVATTLPVDDRARLGAAEDVELRHVRHSLGTLQASKARLDDLHARTADASTALGGIRSWYVDPQSNSVVVTAAPNATQQAVEFVALSVMDADQVTVRTAAREAGPQATVRGGIRYDIGNVYCSVAFAVTKGAQKGFLTAGHCVDPGQVAWIGGERIGAVAATRYGGGVDRAWVRVQDVHRLSPWVQKDANTIGVRGRTRAPVGASVCRSGARTGYHCGRLVADDVTVRYVDGTVLRNMSMSNACSGQGDSGGTWITPGGDAQGVHSGGTITPSGTTCGLAPGDRSSYYSRINPILEDYGLTLVKVPE